MNRERRRAVIVADLGFGDAGKGLITDYLVRRTHAQMVVRANGGAQAGHNVVTPDGRHHTFSQLGSGTFVPGIRTHLSGAVVVHPTALVIEARRLAAVNVSDALERLSVSDAALVVTPFHQAAGRLRELARGDQRHGSCGVGIGEVVRVAQERPELALRMGDLRDAAKVNTTLAGIRELLRHELREALLVLRHEPDARDEIAILEAPCDSELIQRWLSAVAGLIGKIRIVEERSRVWLPDSGAVIFEGAQGVLLDEWYGFHPHTTWSNCTFDNALALLAQARFDGEIMRLGVLRSYAVRHGRGPLPTESAALTTTLSEPHNPSGPWQGSFRAGWPDHVLSRYAIAACRGVDALALTHLDTIKRFPQWQHCEAYEVPASSGNPSLEIRDLTISHTRDLEHQAALTRLLERVRPICRATRSNGAARQIDELQSALGVPVVLQSFGPRAGDVRARATHEL